MTIIGNPGGISASNIIHTVGANMNGAPMSFDNMK
jgi:hypothetical protein